MTLQLVSRNTNFLSSRSMEEIEARITSLQESGESIHGNTLEAVYKRLTGEAPKKPFSAEQRRALKAINYNELYSNRSELREYLDRTLGR